jgi:iron complex transport system substrate-binding protein
MLNKSKLSTIVFIIMLVISACASPATEVTQAAATEAAVTTEPSAPEVAASAYPVTIAHKFGSTSITEYPERIVLVGLTDQDVLLALGIVPVATREWWGERPGAIFEWATDELGDAELPLVLPGTELNFEQIAELNPDVIVGLYAGITQEEYDTLSKIAPVVAQPAEYPDWGIPWQDSTRTMGLIVGKSAEAETLIVDVEARFAAIREEHPEFADQVGVVASAGESDYWAYSSLDPRGQFLTSLGFQPAIELDEIIGAEFGAPIDLERYDLINDAGVLIWFTGDKENMDALYEQLDVHKEGRDIMIGWEDPMAFAFSFNTVLSLPYVLDELVPQVVAASDGDPATK